MRDGGERSKREDKREVGRVNKKKGTKTIASLYIDEKGLNIDFHRVCRERAEGLLRVDCIRQQRAG